MDDLDLLRTGFGIPGAVEIGTDAHGLTRLTLSTPAAEAHVYLHGAHVTHYQPRGAAPVLFMSAHSRFAPGQPIRGGVPVIFPWFGPHPTRTDLPAHGYARTRPWDLVRTASAANIASAAFLLSDAPRLELGYRVSVGPALELSLEVRNISTEPVTFEQALHTYLAVDDVRGVRVEGLSLCDYIDKVDGMKRKRQSGPVAITGETDRIYLDTNDTVTVHDEAAGRRLSVSKSGSASTVLWNPWVGKAKKMPDFGDDEWPRMICVETANVADNAVTLAPGAAHVMRAVVAVQ
jgi:glucose-6-phosphate 1-epimerase